MTAKDILVKARALIEKPENWCQRMFAMTAHGGPTLAASPASCAWCATGAVMKAAAGEPGWANLSAAGHRLSGAASALGKDNAFQLNDTTDHATVLKMFDLAIAEAE